MAERRPRRERDEEVLVWPDLVFVEFIAALLFTVTLTILAFVANAPLQDTADPNHTPNPAKPPWYFLTCREVPQQRASFIPAERRAGEAAGGFGGAAGVEPQHREAGAGEMVGENEEWLVAEQALVAVLRARAGDQDRGGERAAARGQG